VAPYQQDPEELREPLARIREFPNQLRSQRRCRLGCSDLCGLFILQSLNEMIDLVEKRMAALENRIPPTIWIMLTVIGVLTCLVFGCVIRRRFWLVSLITPLMIAVLLSLIADLD